MLLLAVVLVATAMLVVLGSLVRVQSARSTARAAADLAALGAASLLALPPGVEAEAGLALDVEAACTRAAELAERNGARLTACEADTAGVVRVEAAQGTPWGEAHASAAAGPASARLSPARP